MAAEQLTYQAATIAGSDDPPTTDPRLGGESTIEVFRSVGGEIR